jgi:hypothetical protein
VAVRGATELISRAAEGFIGDPQTNGWLVQLDFKNAYNSLSRALMIQRVREAAPTFSQWVGFKYGSPAPLFLRYGVQLKSREGVQQGDPLGPLLFSLAIHPLVKRVHGLTGIKWTTWYLDDGNLFASPSAARASISLIEEVGPLMGLFLNKQKSTITGAALTPHQLEAYGLQDLRLCMDGNSPAAIVLGNPIGSPKFVQANVVPVVNKVARFFDALPRLLDPQVELFLARYSLSICRITHLMRAQPPSVVGIEFGQFVAIIKAYIARLVACPVTAEAWTQVGLPLRLGGLGLTHPGLSLRHTWPQGPGTHVGKAGQRCGGNRRAHSRQSAPRGDGPPGASAEVLEQHCPLSGSERPARQSFGTASSPPTVLNATPF